MVLSACTPILTSQTQARAVRPDFGDLVQHPERSRGALFLLGGVIVRPHPIPEGTLIEVSQRPLRRSGRFRFRARSEGSFLVRLESAVDPAVFYPGRKIVVYGILTPGIDLGTDGGGGPAYRYPVLRPVELHLL